jgi:hypothetical protein
MPKRQFKCEECKGDLILVGSELVCSVCGLVQLYSISSNGVHFPIIRRGVKLDDTLKLYVDSSEQRILAKVRGKRNGRS